ncbi:bioflim formation protein [Oceanithermus sp.]
MKKLLISAALLLGLALASAPAYPENGVGLGYVYPTAGELNFGMVLPFAPAGMETGLDLEVRYPRLGVSAAGKVLLLPSLTVGGQFVSVGLYSELRYAEPGSFGGYLGGVFSWELPELGPVTGALSGRLGLGYFPKGSWTSFVGYGLGLRLYYEPVALELASNDRDLFRASLLFLW